MELWIMRIALAIMAVLVVVYGIHALVVGLDGIH